MAIKWQKAGVKRYTATVDGREYVIEAVYAWRSGQRITADEIVKMGEAEAVRRRFNLGGAGRYGRGAEIKWAIKLDGADLNRHSWELTLKKAKEVVNGDCAYWAEHGMSTQAYVDKASRERRWREEAKAAAFKAVADQKRAIVEAKLALADAVLENFGCAPAPRLQAVVDLQRQLPALEAALAAFDN